jgi:hypothetical protein
MENAVRDKIVLAISLVILSSLVSTIAWTFVIGMSIGSSFQDKMASYYSDAGVSMMIDFNNIDNVDAPNIYKMLEINRNVIKDYSIKNLDGSFVLDNRDLLSRPTDRFSITIRGDSSTGFQVEIEQVLSQGVGG